ncbi:MAG TPA: YdcF family protein [Bryobacteraceae bacterium]|nr:YdcF family protein [Bryobacteraceae bacterium]
MERDATVVLGNGLREGGKLPSWTRRKLDRALALYGGEHLILSSGGTTYRPPPLDEHGYPIYEAYAAAQYLIQHGIPADRILAEANSYDTVGNAFFTRVIHAEPLGLARLLVIASDFHMARTEAVFRWVYGLEPRAVPFHLRFEAVTDPTMDPAVLQARYEGERKRLEGLVQVRQRITTFHELHRWLFAEHEAYNAGHKAFSPGRVKGPILESY